MSADELIGQALQDSDSALLLRAADFIEEEFERFVGDLPPDMSIAQVSPRTAAMIWVLQTRAQQIDMEEANG